MDHMVCYNAAAEQVVFQHIQNGRFPAAANPGKDLHQRNIPIGFQHIQIVGSNDHGIASLLLVYPKALFRSMVFAENSEKLFT